MMQIKCNTLCQYY